MLAYLLSSGAYTTRPLTVRPGCEDVSYTYKPYTSISKQHVYSSSTIDLEVGVRLDSGRIRRTKVLSRRRSREPMISVNRTQTQKTVVEENVVIACFAEKKMICFLRNSARKR